MKYWDNLKEIHFLYVFDVFLVYTPVKVKFLISQPVRCSQALRMQWWLQVCHQENQERQSTRDKSPIIVRTIWNWLEALISYSTEGLGANIWFLEGKRYFDRLVLKNDMTPAFLAAGVPETGQKFSQCKSFNNITPTIKCKVSEDAPKYFYRL